MKCLRSMSGRTSNIASIASRAARATRTFASCALVAGFVAGCGSHPVDGNDGNGGLDSVDSRGTAETVGQTSAPLELSAVSPLSQVYVKNVGALDVETDYLPNVVCCENGDAPKVALEAQAIMARTYLYFLRFDGKKGTSAAPISGTSDQVYSCGKSATAACKSAVAATDGQILTYTDASTKTVFSLISFFVDGPRPSCLSDDSCACAKPTATTSMSPAAHPSACDCFDWSSNGGANPAYITYNWSKSGDDVAGSTIGNTSHESNRGCASQNIQACLATAGWKTHDVLRFFYGQDVELRLADGTLVADDPPPSSADAGAATDSGPSMTDAAADEPSENGSSTSSSATASDDDASTDTSGCSMSGSGGRSHLGGGSNAATSGILVWGSLLGGFAAVALRRVRPGRRRGGKMLR